jgi:hypothetical protein
MCVYCNGYGLEVDTTSGDYGGPQQLLSLFIPLLYGVFLAKHLHLSLVISTPTTNASLLYEEVNRAMRLASLYPLAGAISFPPYLGHNTILPSPFRRIGNGSLLWHRFDTRHTYAIPASCMGGAHPQLDEFYFTTDEKKILENCRCIVPNFMND